jgi:hypothetical protein
LASKKITEAQVIDLVLKGQTGVIKGFLIPGSTSPIAGKLKFDPNFNVAIE